MKNVTALINLINYSLKSLRLLILVQRRKVCLWWLEATLFYLSNITQWQNSQEGYQSYLALMSVEKKMFVIFNAILVISLFFLEWWVDIIIPSFQIEKPDNQYCIEYYKHFFQQASMPNMIDNLPVNSVIGNAYRTFLKVKVAKQQKIKV